MQGWGGSRPPRGKPWRHSTVASRATRAVSRTKDRMVGSLDGDRWKPENLMEGGGERDESVTLGPGGNEENEE
jgi:hypothetical protein